ncbi:hypothetical protein CYMTET_22623 [Cymbomonas tetramitiformis]|uniref:Uncharacterized protein n=1 Tax=Cymbomonas tetramitiformis TaxID=36881 RepID=A0AAE0FZU5_9CHLO|nr:hypothetical protein CYMTET_22623 [Cymbomonas tetramitiformis]
MPMTCLNSISLVQPRFVTKTPPRVAASKGLSWSHSHAIASKHSVFRIASKRSVSRANLQVSAEQMQLLPIDEAREQERKNRRVVFDQDRWKRHRSVNRYARHISTLNQSSITKDLAPAVFFLTSVAGAVTAVNEFTDLPNLVLPLSALGPTTAALSLLLVFRTNSSYGRWWEARKIWGGLLNRSRDFVRQGLSWFKVEDTASKEQLVRYTMAFAVALKVWHPFQKSTGCEGGCIRSEHGFEMGLACSLTDCTAAQSPVYRSVSSPVGTIWDDDPTCKGIFLPSEELLQSV